MRRARNSQPHDDDAHDRLNPWVVDGCEGRYMAHRTWQVVTGKQLLPLAASLPSRFSRGFAPSRSGHAPLHHVAPKEGMDGHQMIFDVDVRSDMLTTTGNGREGGGACQASHPEPPQRVRVLEACAISQPKTQTCGSDLRYLQ